MSQPIAFCGSSCARASYTSSSVNEMLLNCIVGTCREETGGSLKLLLVKVELKNLLNISAFCRGLVHFDCYVQCSEVYTSIQ